MLDPGDACLTLRFQGCLSDHSFPNRQLNVVYHVQRPEKKEMATVYIVHTSSIGIPNCLKFRNVTIKKMRGGGQTLFQRHKLFVHH